MSPEKISSWHDLIVWQKAHLLALEVYRITKVFPADERYRLIDQLCRAATSVPTNIAEGKGRDSLAEFNHFLVIARGSLEETRYLLLLARDLGYIAADQQAHLESIATEISKMLNALLKSLGRQP